MRLQPDGLLVRAHRVRQLPRFEVQARQVAEGDRPGRGDAERLLERLLRLRELPERLVRQAEAGERLGGRRLQRRRLHASQEPVCLAPPPDAATCETSNSKVSETIPKQCYEI